MALYLVARGLVGEWRGSLIRHGSVLEIVSYFVHTRILLRESCVIQTTVLVNSGDRRVYSPRRSRFRPPINTTLLTSSRLHYHLHPPLARSPSLSLSLKSLPWRRRSSHASTRSHRPPRTLTRRAATRTPTCRRRGCAGPPNFGLVLGSVQSLSVEVAVAG